MKLCFVCLWMKVNEAIHSLTPSDLTCKRRYYRLITDRSNYIITPNNLIAAIHATIGLDENQPSLLLTQLWHREISQQPLILDLSSHYVELYGDFDSDSNIWLMNFSSVHKASSFDSTLSIRSTLLSKRVDLLLQSNDLAYTSLKPTNTAFEFEAKQEDACSSPKSPKDFALCCQLCTLATKCPDINISVEQSRYDITVTDRGLLVAHFTEESNRRFTCLLFPSSETIRFWSTITDTMNIDQRADRDDLMIVQHSYGVIHNYFYYSTYLYYQWNKQTTDFHFLDVVFIPYKHLAIFHLNQCNVTRCQLVLRVYRYQLNKILEFSQQLYHPEVIVEENVSSQVYFRLHFDLLSNMLYLIGQEAIYASNDYGVRLTRIWRHSLSTINSIIHNPIMFSDTGHIAFIYELNKTICCYYFAVFSKSGLYYGWRTETFRSFIKLNKPFFFDVSGSLYFNASPPVLIIQATEQSLMASQYLLMNLIPGPIFIHKTDLNQLFVFCSLSVWHESFQLIGSSIQFDQLGLFFIINMDVFPSSEFAFCLQTYPLSHPTLPPFRQCQLTIYSSSVSKNLHLQLSGCSFGYQDQNSTIITSKFPSIFLETVVNETFAYGRIFNKTLPNNTYIVDQWNLIHLQKVDQVLDRCLLQNINPNIHRPPLVSIQPGATYMLSYTHRLVTKNFYFLTNNDYQFHGNSISNTQYLTASLFNNRKSIINQVFTQSQLSCHLPSQRTITFVTKCLKNTVIRSVFEIDPDLSKLTAIEPPANFQLERYRAGFHSVIVYNVDVGQEKSICDGFKNCSCISTLMSNNSIMHCAERSEHIGKPTDKSIFLIEEVSNRVDFQIIDNLWTSAIKEEYLNLFQKNIEELIDIEMRIFHILNSSLPHDKLIFLGGNLKLHLLDEGLFHFRITYLWGDQYCLTSSDLIIMVISNTPTLTSYTFNYLLACILILIVMCVFWVVYVIFSEKILRKYWKNFFQSKRESFFVKRSINDHMNFEMLVKIREQSQNSLTNKKMNFQQE
ncbi:unnamed protein product [Adineta ricciae]|uniref:Uncharacterized protein n=1 Tax=Adineta ricciae TaxID=249248 RepID=A0A814I7G4_ADIRI|nr:unnamed protein product [Adineta ricciae]